VIGMGKLGTQVAAVGRAFGMKVIGWSRSLTVAQCDDLGIDYAPTLPDVLRVADVVTLHVTLNAQTRDLIGARELALMKPDAVLVNTARGPIVTEAALVARVARGSPCRRRPRRVRRGTAPGRASLPHARQRGGDAAPGLCHARELCDVLWRCRRRHRKPGSAGVRCA
jgi:hypothetical protein